MHPRRPRSQLAQVIGEENVELLVQALGGGRYSVANTPERASRFAMLDAEVLARLCDAFGGTRIELPSGKGQNGREVSLARVVVLTAKGKSAKQIARILGCSPRTITKKRTMSKAAGVPHFPRRLT
jgi:DNA-binding NarL/FixJ family response regulator